ncbi:MAG: hypothetical protein J7L26_03605 [Candidatus Aminicenantes bacterium]|nr:hypothetical protein [Candidatus Aminicenantes bacterium]
MRKFSQKILRESLKNTVKNLNQSTWPIQADMFVKWLVECPEESKKSFDLFHSFLEREAPDWIVEELPEDIRGNTYWNFDVHHENDYNEKDFLNFAEIWVHPDEREAYLNFCKKEVSWL